MPTCWTWGLVLLLAHSPVASAVEPGATAPATRALPRPVLDSASPAVQSRASDRPALEKAVAGVVVGALAAQFDGRAVEARFGAIDDQPGDAGRRAISGEGQMRFAGDLAWIGFAFRTQYDVLLGQAAAPELVLGVGEEARPVPNDTAVVQQLDDRLVQALRADLAFASIRLQLDRIESVETGQNYLLIDAWGLADFARDGSSKIRIAAFYDRRSGQWLQLHYDLGEAPDTAMPPVAGR
jgi:hypothetical protein